MLSRFNIVNDKSCSNFNLSYWPERQSYLFQHRKRQVLLLHHLRFTFALLLCCLTPFGVYHKRQMLLQLEWNKTHTGLKAKFQYRKRQVLFQPIGIDITGGIPVVFQYRKRQVLLLHHLRFTFALLRHLRCADLIVALLLCCLAPFGAYRNGKGCYTSLKNMQYISVSSKGFNTVNGKYYFLINFVLPSLHSGTCNVWASSSLCSSAVSHPSASTVNGKHCCNPLQHLLAQQFMLRFNTVNGKHCCNIDQRYGFRR